MSAGQEQAWAAGSRQSAWVLPDALRSNSSRRRSSLDGNAEQQEEQLDDFEQLVKAALEDVPESRRSMVGLLSPLSARGISHLCNVSGT